MIEADSQEGDLYMYNLALVVVVFLILGGVVYNLSKNKSAKQKSKEVKRAKTAATDYSSGIAKNSSTYPNGTDILLFHPSLYEVNNYDGDDDHHKHHHSSHSHHSYDSHSHHHDSNSYGFDSSSDSSGSFSSCD